MAIELIKKVFALPEQPGMTQVTKLVFLKLADSANDKGICWPSHGLLERQCWLSKSAIKQHIKKLQMSGFLMVQHRKSGTINQSNYYQINIELLRQLASPENLLGHDVTEDGSSDTLALGHYMTDGGASGDYRTVKEPSTKPLVEPSFSLREKKKTTTSKKPTSSIEDWQAPNDLITACLAMPNCHNIDINQELEKFKDYYLSKGEQRADWNASFRNWWRNAIDRQKNRPATSRNFNQPLSLSDKARRANEVFLSLNPESTSSNADIIEHIALEGNGLC